MTENDVPITEYLEAKYERPDPWDFESSAYERRKYRRQLQLIADRVSDPARILELGCAEGVHTEMLAERFPDAAVTGVDIVEQAIDRARERLSDERVTFRVGDARSVVSELDPGFDVIVCSETIYYLGADATVPELFQFCKRLAELLTPDGLVCMANIRSQTDSRESPLNRAPVLEAYHRLLTGPLQEVHRARYREAKREGDSPYTYEVWGFEP